MTLLVFALSISIWIPCLGQSDSAEYKLSVKRQDSAIKFAESVKTLRDLFDVSIKEAAHFKSAFSTEKENRAKDARDYKIIIDGYAAIETSNRIEIATLNKKYRGQVRKSRFLFVLAIGGVGFGLYKTFIK